MTTTTPSAQGRTAPVEQVTFTIDDVEVTVPKGTLVIRAAEEIGIAIPRFCEHPLLQPVGACRQCLVEVAMPDREGNVRPMPKPQTACTLEAAPGMVVQTQHTSAVADKAQHGQIEFLLINHPLDCPTCDKGGECPLQNQAMSNGYGTSRFHEPKRTFPKPIALSSQILLDRDRCILCQRCTRFQEEIAGDPFIALQGRGGGTPGMDVHGPHGQQIGRFDVDVLDFEGAEPVEVYAGAQPDGTPIDASMGLPAQDPAGPAGDRPVDASGRAFSSYYSGNIVQICPVGALTSAAYRFRSRPFDLVSSPGIAEHDSNGAAIRVDHRRGVVMRRLADEDPAVNEEWLTDKDRFAYPWQGMPDRLTTPLLRERAADGTRGELVPVSWSEAIDAAADGLRDALAAGGVGVLPGGRLTVEDAYAYAKFARVALGTNDVDHRARPGSDEELAFLGHAVAGRTMDVTFADLEHAPTTLLVGFEPEDEGGIVFLRLRKGVRKHRNRVFSVAPFASRGLVRLDGVLVPAAPGTEAEVLDALTEGADGVLGEAGAALGPDAVVVAGERLAEVPGALSAVLRLVERTGARLAWIPRRIGERGGVEVGTLPGLLPGGRPVADAEARVDVATAWDVERLPDAPGRTTEQILADVTAGTLGGLVVGGVDPGDLRDPRAVHAALEAARFVVSLEVRASAVTDAADVVLPVAPPVEKAGTYLNWEGRVRQFPQALASTAMPDHRVLDMLADALDVRLGLRTGEEVRAELDQLGAWDGNRVAAPTATAVEPPRPGTDEAVLATWHLMLDEGRCQDGEAFLAGTAHRPVARVSPALAERLGLGAGDGVTVRTDRGQVTLPVVPTPMPDGIVWLPTNSRGSAVRATLGAGAGSVVSISAAALVGAAVGAGSTGGKEQP